MQHLAAPQPATPEEIFAAVRAVDAARPIVTFYDRATGERAELSAASLGNWIAKTHFLITDELGLGVGDAAYVDLPVHWLTLAVWLGSFSAGLSLTSDASGADVAFADVDGLREIVGVATEQAAPDIYAVPLLPWGRTFDSAPAGASDYVAAVRPQADAWASVHRSAGPNDRATETMTRWELVDAARARAARLSLTDRARVLVTDRTDRRLSVVDVLATLSVAGSLVLVRNAAAVPDPAASDAALIAQEQVTVAL